MSERSRIGLIDLARTAIAFGLAAVSEIGLRTLPLPRLARLVGIPLVTDHATPEEYDGPIVIPSWARHRLAASRRALRHWPFGDTCLRKALVGGAMIRRLDPALRIGVAKQDGELKAHAWIELEGFSLDPSSEDFETVESAWHR